MVALAVCSVTEAEVVMLVDERTFIDEVVHPSVTEAAKLIEAVDEPVAAKVRFPQVPVVVMLLLTAIAAFEGRTTSPAASAV